MPLFAGLLTRGQPGIMMFPNLWLLDSSGPMPCFVGLYPAAGERFKWFHQECGEISRNRKSPELLNCDSGAGPKVDGSSQARGSRSGTYDIIESLSDNDN